MAFWDNIGKFKDRGDTDPDMAEKKADENIESFKSKREKFVESLKAEVNDSDDIAEKDKARENVESNNDSDDTDDVDNNVDMEGPERTPEKTRDDDDDNVR